MSIFRGLLVSSAAVLLSGAALAQNTGARLTDGDALFDTTSTGSGAMPTSNTGATSTSSTVQANFRVAGGTGGVDNSYVNYWWYRVEGDTRERNMHSASSRTLTGTNQADWGFSNLTSTGTNILSGVTANMRYIVSDTGTDSANVATTMTIVNNSPAALTISLFWFQDIYLGGQDAGDIVDALVNSGGNKIWNIRDTTATTTPTWFMQMKGFGAFGAMSGAFSSTGPLFNTTVDNFSPDVGAGGQTAGDRVAAFQWRVTIPGGGSYTATGAMCAVRGIPLAQNVAGSTFCTATPEPASLALLALGGLLFARRR